MAWLPVGLGDTKGLLALGEHDLHRVVCMRLVMACTSGKQAPAEAQARGAIPNQLTAWR